MELLPEAHCWFYCKTSITCKESNNIKEKTATDTVKIFIDLKFSGNTADVLEITVKFVVHYQTTKLSYFTNTKDKTPFLSQSSVV